MNKERIVVSAEIKTILSDLYNQIEYELRDDYKDSLEKTTQALLDIKEYIEKTKWFRDDQIEVDILHPYLDYILDIVNKALGSDSNE